jgi:cell division protein FtsQ
VKKTGRKNRYIKQNATEGDSHRRPVRKWLSGVVRIAAGVAIISVMSLVCVFLHDWVTQCSYFRAVDVVVTGCNRLDPEMIRSTAGIEKGVNILSINLASARKRLLAEPWIEDAGIRRIFPSMMTIEVKEHEALAVIDFGRPFLINGNGLIFKEFEAGKMDPAHLPVISGVAYEDWTAGSALPSNGKAEVFSAVMRVLELGAFENSVIPNYKIKRIIVDKEIGLTLKIRDSMEFVELGFGDYQKKLERFAVVTAHLERSDIKRTFSQVDLKNPDRIVARPVSANQVVAGKGGSSEGT